MGSKKRKNSNYVTDKTIREKEEKERAESARKKRKIVLIAISAFLAAALVITGIVALIISGIRKSSRNFEVTHHAEIVIKDYGTIHLELYGKEAPITVENFVDLAESGFYDGLTIHTAIDGYMIQGGRSTTEQRPAIKGEFYYNDVENDILHERGVISMARFSGDSVEDFNSATTEFFIIQNTEKAEHLNDAYAAFGRVISGMDVVDKICSELNPYDEKGTLLPSEQPIITSIRVHSPH